MKTLSVKQPWASFLVKGLKNVENLSWNPDYIGKILIHATGNPVSEDFLMQQPLEYMTEILNERGFGNLGLSFKGYLTNAIIGYIDVFEVVEPGQECFSNWNGGNDLYRLKIGEMHEFDEPIVGVMEQAGLWDYPGIDENNLPSSHKPSLRGPILVEDTLYIPVNKTQYDMLCEGETDEWSMFLVRDQYCMNLLDKNGDILKFDYIGFELGNETVCFEALGASVDRLEEDHWYALFPEDEETGTSNPLEFRVKLGDFVEFEE